MIQRALTREQAIEWMVLTGHEHASAEVFSPVCEFGFRLKVVQRATEVNNENTSLRFPFLQFTGDRLFFNYTQKIVSWGMFSSSSKDSVLTGASRLNDLLDQFKKTEPHSDLIVMIGCPEKKEVTHLFTLCDRGAKAWVNSPQEWRPVSLAKRFRSRTEKEMATFLDFLRDLP